MTMNNYITASSNNKGGVDNVIVKAATLADANIMSKSMFGDRLVGVYNYPGNDPSTDIVDYTTSHELRVVAAVIAFVYMLFTKGLIAAVVTAAIAMAIPGFVFLAVILVVGAWIYHFWQAHTWYELFVYPIVVFVGIHYFWTEVVTKESEKAVD